MIFYTWQLEEGKNGESACYVVAPDRSKALDCVKAVTYQQYWPGIQLEVVEAMTKDCGYLSWKCWKHSLGVI